MSQALHPNRVLSGMRPTGRLHLGHYHGVLKNWLTMQHEHECFFMVADWHTITTNYADLSGLHDNVWDMVIDWLAVGVDPNSAQLFIQSWVPEHAELAILLGMVTPLAWLERVPTYKDQQANIKDKDLSNYGFLGYPVLQSADILAYQASMVPVGEDQVPHVELTRNIARRFNHLYGKDAGFIEKAMQAVRKLGKKQASIYEEYRKQFQEKGLHESLEKGQALIEAHDNLSISDRERLMGYLEGGGKIVLPEPQASLTPQAKMPGLDGRKMSKSYANTISLRDDEQTVAKKIKTMPTDPARIRRDDPGEPTKCPLYAFHEIYSDESIKKWAQAGCRSAGIGCIECKQPIIDAILKEQQPIKARADEYAKDTSSVRSIIQTGSERARDVAKETLSEVRASMGLEY